ncbi:dephospho-CoA kinase [Hymenobacter sp. PAMC 26628]|uniref:dephospho-CoA kinase n=1 Tax=Hymenobacter sp. PAMC 26628 TaxID=1484118 RepID=UPI0007701ADC|nr:dephospho-CoA kinase [Hymenobacter sp. PAMC 26628]AMJ67531.1 dephospho-CoA kinase [Hymenobacter sp. PAMC 26628]
MLRIGITGGIGSGKSVVSHVFGLLGIPLYDSDQRARWVMEHDVLLRGQLLNAFGPDAYTAAGHLNRPALARTVFANPAQLAQLNALVHPRVGEDFVRWAAAQQAAGAPYILKEAALLYESGAYKTLDRIITVAAPLAVREARVLRRDPHRTAADVRAIIGKQLGEDERQQRADYVVHNDDVQLVLPQVLALDAQLRALGAPAAG